MSYHIVSINSDTSSISVAKGMLISTSPEGSHSLHVCDQHPVKKTFVFYGDAPSDTSPPEKLPEQLLLW